jgi:terminase small subunit-like protein
MPALSNLKHEAFAQAFVVCGNAAAAYISAGYICARHKARGHGHRLRTREDIAARIDELSPVSSRKRGQIAMQQIAEAVRMGRPTLYRPELCTPAHKMALLGLTDAQIADLMGVPVDTFHRWKAQHRQFRQAIARGKLMADAKVAESLYHRAKGYSHKAEKIFHSVETGVVRAEYTEHYPPDTRAAMFWLKNRQSEKWRERREAGVDAPLYRRLMEMTPEEREVDALELWEKIRQTLTAARAGRPEMVIEAKTTEVDEGLGCSVETSIVSARRN